ncbi:DUF4405 domain-containing protein [Sinorhizobium fredii]|uniref:DUF4405 domain-containing protein n=1 Tax=Rhizobium fredii TaxID=380 RepID=UPI002958A68C|nr:DUF4405 domain-containing protein [Sinorhizobium fredii]WOS65467.1 DUF4405 domain-containing protein [Sinorhizobium fredii GR64]
MLVIVHNGFNRRWYGTIPKARRQARGLFNIAVTFLLLIAMLALLVTSVLISNALSSVMSPYDGFTARQIHILAAYWVLVIVSVHLGLRWPMLMGVARKLTGLSQPHAVRTFALRVITILVAIHGVWSSFELAIGTKLTMQMTLDWWNFEESVAGFFIHCIAIAGLYPCLTYYAAKWLCRTLRFPPRRSGIADRMRLDLHQSAGENALAGAERRGFRLAVVHIPTMFTSPGHSALGCDRAGPPVAGAKPI